MALNRTKTAATAGEGGEGCGPCPRGGQPAAEKLNGGGAVGHDKETAAKEGLAARDGLGGGAGLKGVVPGGRCIGGAPAERRAGHRTIEPVPVSSPVTKGATAEEKVR